MKPQIKRWSLSSRVIKIFITIIFVLTVVILGVQSIVTIYFAQTEFQEYKNNFENQVSNTFGELIWNYDVITLNRLMEQSMVDQRLFSIRIRYGESVNLIWLAKDETGQIKETTSVVTDKDLERNLIPIMRMNHGEENSQVAEAEIWYDKSPYQKDILSNLVVRLSQTGIIIFFSAFVIYWITKIKMAKPLEQIQNYLNEEEFSDIVTEKWENITGRISGKAFPEIIEMSQDIDALIAEIEEKTKGLSRQEVLFRTLVNSVPGVVYRWNANDGKAEDNFVSERCVILTGYDQSQLTSLEEWMIHVHPEDRRKLKQVIFRAGTTDTHFEIEYRMYRLDGKEIWVRDHSTVVLSNGQTVLEGVVIDVTSRNRDREELKNLNIRLEQMIKERTMELKNKNNELKKTIQMLKETQKKAIESEQLASVGRLISGLAHELNTPLGNCLTTASYLTTSRKNFRKNEDIKAERGSLENYFTDEEEAFKILADNLQKAVEIVRAIKPLSINVADKLKETVELREILEDIIVKAQFAFSNYNIHYKIDCKERSQLFCDREALIEVFSHLVENSIIHGFKVGRENTIVMSIREMEKGINIQYSDSGSGIEKEYEGRIFEPFVTSKKREGRIGLGLNIVYKSVLMDLKGTISIENTNETGFCADVYIPKV